MKGKVYLVGAGPGDPELLTLKAFKALKTADIVLHDELIGAEILALVPKTAQVRGVGKRGGRKNIRQEEINALLVQFALQGMQVVRLKGGDPMIFGRAGEEIEALRRADIEVEVIPGVTAALGAAAAAQIPLTHRQISSAVVVLTGHKAETGPDSWPQYLSPQTTVVVYMPGYTYESTAARLMATGLNPSTPCAIISQATTSEKQVYRTTLAALPKAPRLPAPALLVAGEVVRFADHDALQQQFGWAADPGKYFVPAASVEFLAQARSQEQSK
jgi:uroporphyrin-III C-methyltransferase